MIMDMYVHECMYTNKMLYKHSICIQHTHTSNHKVENLQNIKDNSMHVHTNQRLKVIMYIDTIQ